MWLSWLEHRPITKRLQVWFPVRKHTQVVGSTPNAGTCEPNIPSPCIWETTNRCFFFTSCFSLPLPPSIPPSLPLSLKAVGKKNVLWWGLKKINCNELKIKCISELRKLGDRPFTYLVNKSFVSTHNMPGTALGSESTAASKMAMVLLSWSSQTWGWFLWAWVSQPTYLAPRRLCWKAWFTPR